MERGKGRKSYWKMDNISLLFYNSNVNAWMNWQELSLLQPWFSVEGERIERMKRMKTEKKKWGDIGIPTSFFIIDSNPPLPLHTLLSCQPRKASSFFLKLLSSSTTQNSYFVQVWKWWKVKSVTKRRNDEDVKIRRG